MIHLKPLDRRDIFEGLEVPLDLTWIKYIHTNVKWHSVSDDKFVAAGFLDDNGYPNIMIHEKILANATDTQLSHVIAHELGHFIYNHYDFVEQVVKPEMKLGIPHSPQLVNVCGDCGIHAGLADSVEIQKAIELVSPEGVVATYKTRELPELPPILLYRWLQKDVEKQSQEAEGNGGCRFADAQVEMGSHDLKNDGLIVSEDMFEDIKEALGNGNLPSEIREALTEQLEGIQAQLAKQAGSVAGTGREGIVEITKTQYPWVKELLSRLKKALSKNRKPSYRRETRRYSSGQEDIILKGKARMYEPSEVTFCVDVSGSMKPKEVNEALNGLASLAFHYNVTGNVIFFDARAGKKIRVKANMDVNALAHETSLYGGGTDFTPVIPKLNQSEHVVIYTDTWLYNKVDLTKFKTPPIVVTTQDRPSKELFNGVNTYIYTEGGRLV